MATRQMTRALAGAADYQQNCPHCGEPIPRDDIDVMTDYLMLMVKRKDWHGVADAANDIRVIEAERNA